MALVLVVALVAKFAERLVAAVSQAVKLRVQHKLVFYYFKVPLVAAVVPTLLRPYRLYDPRLAVQKYPAAVVVLCIVAIVWQVV